MTVESQQDIDGILAIGAVVALVRDAMLSAVEPGMTTAELDNLGSELLEEHRAQSAPRTCYQFPGSTCISINDEAAHGIPGPRVIRPGDVVSIDVSAQMDGYFADTGGTVVTPPVTVIKTRLLHACRTALTRAMSQARADTPINRIGRTIERTATANGFRVIRTLAGHGVGRSLHEPPEGIVSYFDRKDKRQLSCGQVIAIEPFLATRSTDVTLADDGWTLKTHAANLSAQFEHTIIVTRGAPIVATRGASS